MKAKEYAKQYNEAEDKLKALGDITREFINETIQIIEKKNCTRDSACIAVFKEQNQKWFAFSRLTGVSNELFKFALEKIEPKFKGVI